MVEAKNIVEASKDPVLLGPKWRGIQSFKSRNKRHAAALVTTMEKSTIERRTTSWMPGACIMLMAKACMHSEILQKGQ